MRYKHGTRRKAKEYEADLVKKWKEDKTFEKSVSQRDKSNSYVFYDGPPFITGVPHHGTLLTSIAKDAVPRYQTMKGKRVERVWGWDCHGLPAEVYTEKKFGIKDRNEIGTKISLEEYINTCRANMTQTGSLWEDTIDRIGRWVDFKGAYKTMDKDYMESVWWAFKELYDKGKIYEGERVLMYCTRDATPLSKAEVAMDNSYKDDTDPTVYAKFKLKDEDAYLLAWTTTPWTLLSNTAIAVNKNLTYCRVKVGDEVFILAKGLIEKVLTDEKHRPVEHEVLDSFPGSKLVGKKYQPIVDTYAKLDNDKDKAFRVWHADFVNDEDGTGIAHESPAYGEEDYDLSKKEGFKWVMNTDDRGRYTEGEWKGEVIWDVNKEIAKTLLERGQAWKIEYITHSYPHCHRCDTKLMYRAHPSWFLDVEGQKTEMLEKNGADINWYPEHIKDGRFKNTIETAPDWNLSRDRFWATAMPVWKGTDKSGKEHIKVVGSYKELEELSGSVLKDYHRPWIDDVTFTSDGVKYTRIDKVLDGWFESGSMPFAQFHYPFENKEKFEENFPGDFIVEYMPQVRAWFYYLHVVSVGLFGKSAFTNVIAHGTLAGSDGRKLSKSFGNYTDPNVLMDETSADALRFFLMSSPVMNGEDAALTDKDVMDVNRKLAMIWNMFDFFTMYAEVDKWEWRGRVDDEILEVLTNPLDIWIVSRMNQLHTEIETHMDKYDLPNATRPVLEFIDDASNWYVRRSRKRFWKSDNDSDKDDAYKTLHWILLRLSVVMAPFTPFLSEELFLKLTDSGSVHLLDWPKAGNVNEQLVDKMAAVRNVITKGLAIRAQNSIKVRQPLASVSVPTSKTKLVEEFEEIVKEELNVKNVIYSDHKVELDKTITENIEKNGLIDFHVVLDTKLTKALRHEGIMREVVRVVQGTRKDADLNVDDRIELYLHSDEDSIKEATSEFEAEIKAETLTKTLASKKFEGQEKIVKINGFEVTVILKKAA